MPSYQADQLLAQLLEETLREGGDATAVRKRFVADNSVGGFFNPNLQIDLDPSMTPKDLARLYGGKTPASGTPAAGSSGTTSTRTTTSVTSYPAGSIDELIKTGQGVLERNQGLVGQVSALAKSFSDDVEAGMKTAIEGGQAKGAAVTAKGSQVVGRNTFQENMLRALGLDATDTSSLVRTNVDAAAAAQRTVLELQPQITALRNVSFADDPMAWIKAQFQLEGVVGKYNTAQSFFEQNTKAAGAIQELGNRQLSMQTGINSDLVKQEATAEAEAAAAEGKLRALALQNTSRSAQMAAFSTEISLNQQQFSNAYSLVKLMAERTSYTDAEGKVDKSLQDLAMINIWRERSGGQPLSPDNWKGYTGPEKTKMLELASRKTADIADTPGKALNVLHDFQWYSNFRQEMPPQGQKFLDDFHRKALAQAQSGEFTLKYPKLKDSEKYQVAADQIAQGWRTDLEKRNYANLSQDNPFLMNATLYAQTKSLENNPIAKYVLANTNAGAGLVAKDILSYALSMVRAGEDPDTVAKQINQFFREGMKTQATAYRLSTLGIPLDNPKSKTMEYPVDGNVFGYMERFMDARLANSSKQDLQLLDPVSLKHWLVLNYVQSRNVSEDHNVQMLMGGAAFGMPPKKPMIPQ